MKKSSDKIKGNIKENLALMNTPLMSILPGQISFFVLLSIIPLASILVMFISSLSFSVESLRNFITTYIPTGVSNVLVTVFDQQRAGAIDILFIVAAFYLASKATHSIIVASTQIYNGEQKNFIRTRIKAILMLLILVILILMMIVVLTIGGRFMNYLREINEVVHPVIYWVYTIFKWPFAFFMVFIVVKVIYTLAPNVTIPSKSVNKGALLTTVIWVLSTFVFSFYITNFANFDKFYGGLSNLIILMMWIYWLCYAFVFGMTVNEYKLTKK